MPKGKRLDASAKCDIYDAYLSGVPQVQIAEDFGVSAATVSRIIKGFKLSDAHEEERMDKQKVIDGNRQDGQLWHSADARDLYEGTCRQSNGKFARKRFHASGDIIAKNLWRSWCERVRAEDAEPEPFAKATVPDKEPEVKTTVVEEPVDVTPAPAPEIDVVRREEPVTSDIVVPDKASVEHPESETSYIVILTKNGCKPYGIYRSMERAMEDCDRMNDALSFAGFESAYDVFEVEWRG